jgi:putative phage-type endonuclease
LVRSVDREAWLEARKGGVSATEVAAAATPSGFEFAIQRRQNYVETEPNAVMIFGTESEPAIMRYAHTEHGILPSDWLIAADTDRRHMATPDGLAPDHSLIAECKTTGKDWGESVPIAYRRQVQWQLHCTGAERCLFLWQLRIPDGDWFRFGWWEPRWVWIDRDEQMITSLIATATRLLSLED